MKALVPTPIHTVAIGGVKLENSKELLVGSSGENYHLDGLAIVSAIMAAPDPTAVCSEFQEIIKSSIKPAQTSSADKAVAFAVQAATKVKNACPMVHHMTSKYFG